MGFNTQPPEGGCKSAANQRNPMGGFNTQPPEGGCVRLIPGTVFITEVSTHSHPKVAALSNGAYSSVGKRFNTQPPEGGCSLHKKARKISKLNTVFR